MVQPDILPVTLHLFLSLEGESRPDPSLTGSASLVRRERGGIAAEKVRQPLVILVQIGQGLKKKIPEEPYGSGRSQ